MNLRLMAMGAMVLFTTALMAPNETKASPEDGLVEVRSMNDVYLPYRRRRVTHGWQFAAGMENFFPNRYLSDFDDYTYEDMFGKKSILMTNVETGYKFNFSAGSLSLLVGYGMGQIQSESIGELRTFAINKLSGRLMYIMDNFLDEPWIAPYGAVGLHRMDITEKIPDSELSFKGQAKPNMMLTVGVLLQLNWIEPDEARAAYLGSHMQNTYLDLFLTQYSATQSETEPDISTAFNWGAGLRIEF